MGLWVRPALWKPSWGEMVLCFRVDSLYSYGVEMGLCLRLCKQALQPQEC